jgi:hypothetical protein
VLALWRRSTLAVNGRPSMALPRFWCLSVHRVSAALSSIDDHNAAFFSSRLATRLPRAGSRKSPPYGSRDGRRPQIHAFFLIVPVVRHIVAQRPQSLRTRPRRLALGGSSRQAGPPRAQILLRGFLPPTTRLHRAPAGGRRSVLSNHRKARHAMRSIA